MNIKKYILLITLLAILPINYSLAGLVPCGASGQAPCTLCHLIALFQNLLDLFVKVIIWYIALFFLMYGGFLIIMDKKTQGIQTIKRVLTGLAIVLLAWTIINTIIYIIGPNATDETGAPLNKSWNKIKCES